MSGTTRNELRKQIATHIYRAAQHKPMTLTADGGQLAALLAELALKLVEESGLYVRNETRTPEPSHKETDR